MGKYSVTRDGLGSPRSSFRTRIPSQTMPKAPTCPPNATVQAEFQNRNVKEMLRSENNEPEEIMIRKQYPLLASIIIRDQKCNMADQYDYRPERQNYIRCKYPIIWSYGSYVMGFMTFMITFYDIILRCRNKNRIIHL